ncbi:MAG: hypothetical protein H0V00_15355 [Chloroflexia bacterium]|nr:hypothetical protein [Chloroflexia bacterium]
METTMFWGHVTTDGIQRAYDRLVAYHERNDLPIDPSVTDAADGWNRQLASAVNRMLTDLWEHAEYGDRRDGGNVYRGGRAVFRRAVGSRSATGLLVDSGGSVQYSR